MVWVYEKIAGRKPSRKSVKQICHRDFYYAGFDQGDLTHLDAIEYEIRKIENLALPIIKKFPRQKAIPILSSKEQAELATFIGLSMTRVPNFRDPVHDIHEWAVKQFLDRHIHEGKDVPEEIVRLHEAGEIKVNIDPAVSLSFMIQNANQISLSILKKGWQFFVPTNGSFVTSDNPVFFDFEIKNAPVGPAHPLSEVVMALRHDLAIVCTPKQPPRTTQTYFINNDELTKFNRGTIRAAKRWVVGNSMDTDLEKMVIGLIGTEQTIKID